MVRKDRPSELEIMLRTRGIENYLQTKPDKPIYLVVDTNHHGSIAAASFDRAAASTTKVTLNEHIATGSYEVQDITAEKLFSAYGEQDRRHIMEYLVAAHVPKTHRR
jgi:hypothetical protein